MNPTRRTLLKYLAGSIAGLLASQSALALNPQPEVPSKPRPAERTNPKALNPQPELPSKPKKTQRHRQTNRHVPPKQP